MVDFRIVVQVDASKAEQGSRRVEQSLNRVGASADRVRNLITGAFASLGGALLIHKVIEFADSFTNIQNAVRVATGGVGDLSGAMDQLFEISNRTRTSIDANVQLFQRLSFAAGELGASQEQLFKFVETTGKALAIQGGSSAAASGALLQLSQAIGSGVVHAQEFNSVLEGAFPIALAAARGITAAGGSVAKLRQLINAGKVTSKEFFEGFLKQSEALGKQFATTTPTIGQAFTVLSTNLTKFIGELDHSQGVTTAFAKGLIIVANNLSTITRVAAEAGAALLIAISPILINTLIPKLITGLLGVGRALIGIAVAAGPIGIAAGLLAALAVAAQETTGGLFESSGVLVQLGDVAKATFTIINNYLDQLASALQTAVGPAFGDLKSQIGSIRSILATVFNFLVGVVDDVLGLFIGLGRATAVALTGAFTDFPTFIEAIFITAFNNALIVAQVSVNTLVDLLNKLPGLDIGHVAFEKFKIEGESAAVDLSKRITNAFSSGFNEKPVAAFVKTIETESVKVAQSRIAHENRRKAVNQENISTAKAVELTQAETTKLETLIDKLDKAGAITRQFTKDQDLLQKAFQAGKITQEQLISLQEELVKQRNKAQVDLNRQLLDQRTDFGAGVERTLLDFQKNAQDTASQVETLLTGAFDKASDALFQFTQNGKIDFAGFLRDIGQQLLKFGSQRLLSNLFTGIGNTASTTGGSLGGLAGIASSVFGGLFKAANGADIAIGGNGGTDQNILSINDRPVARVSRGETVSVNPQGGGGRRSVNNFYFPPGTDVTSFRRSQNQIEARQAIADNRASKRNN